jgi:Skp family chaperone for outer membrane proteins
MTQVSGRRHFIASALTFGAVGAAASAATPLDLTSPQAGSKYRYINLNKAIAQWDYVKKQQDEFEKEFGGKMDALQTRQKDIQKKRDQLTELQKGGQSAQTRELERTITIATGELQYDLDQLKKESEERRLRILLAAYQQIQEVAGKWAAQNNVDAVFVVQDDDPSDQNLVRRYERASVRQVLWYAKELDVTDQLLKLLR